MNYNMHLIENNNKKDKNENKNKKQRESVWGHYV